MSGGSGFDRDRDGRAGGCGLRSSSVDYGDMGDEEIKPWLSVMKTMVKWGEGGLRLKALGVNNLSGERGMSLLCIDDNYAMKYNAMSLYNE